jgi:hypothetical protein
MVILHPMLIQLKNKINPPWFGHMVISIPMLIQIQDTSKKLNVYIDLASYA